jgi:hypothetical protein
MRRSREEIRGLRTTVSTVLPVWSRKIPSHLLVCAPKKRANHGYGALVFNLGRNNCLWRLGCRQHDRCRLGLLARTLRGSLKHGACQSAWLPPNSAGTEVPTKPGPHVTIRRCCAQFPERHRAVAVYLASQTRATKPQAPARPELGPFFALAHPATLRLSLPTVTECQPNDATGR